MVHISKKWQGRERQQGPDWKVWGGREGTLVMAEQASTPIDLVNQVRGLSDNHVLRTRLPGLQHMLPRGPLIPQLSRYTCLYSDHPREQTDICQVAYRITCPRLAPTSQGRTGNWMLPLGTGCILSACLEEAQLWIWLQFIPVLEPGGRMWRWTVGAPRFLALTQLRLEVGKGRVGQRQI